MRYAGLLSALALAVVPLSVAWAKPKINQVTPSAKQVKKFDTLELTLDLNAEYDNPFNPEEIDLSAVFTSPRGKEYRVNGFYWQDFTRELKEGREALTPKGDPAWKVRFTPDQPGNWRYRLSVKDRTGTAEKSGRLRVTPSEAKGFIRRSPKSSHYLQYDDGSPYFLIGENVGWAGQRGTYDYDDWYNALGKAGANWSRVWMVSWNMGLEWQGEPSKETGPLKHIGYQGLGRYAMENAWRIDTMLNAAERNGLAVMLTLGTYGDLKDEKGFFGEQAWDKNPYNARNGGPAQTPADFFTHPEAREYYKQKMRYIVARYGHTPAIHSWEFFNEMNVPTPWADEMSRTLRGFDPYKHLISHTYGNDEVWKLPNIDFTQNHHYGDGVAMRDSGPIIAATNLDHTERFGKPHLMAEFGIDWKKPDREYDPKGLAINMHNGLWASAASRGMGGAAIWWWDNYVHPLNLYHEFTPLSKFAKRIPWSDREWTPLKGEVIQSANTAETFTDLVIPAQFGWGKVPGEAVYTLAPNGTVSGGPTPQYLYSEGKKEIRSVPRFEVDYAEPGKFIVRVQQSMGDNRLKISVDGEIKLLEELPAGPGEGPWKSSELQKEWNTYLATYDKDFAVDVPAGRHVIEVENAGGDWMLVSEYRLTGYRSSRYPEVRLLGQQAEDRAMIWVQDEKSNWVEAQKGTEPQTWESLTVKLDGLPRGRYNVTWWDTRKGEAVRESHAQATANGLILRVPPFQRDIAADIAREK